MPNDVFHAGERLAQRLAGVELHGAPIRPAMTDQHRSFFAQLPILFVALPDRSGWPVATVLTGPPGFVASPDPVTLRVGVAVPEGDPAAEALEVGAPAGLLGLEFATRRRNRANGVVAEVGPERWTVAVRESFGNCPQYIQTREMVAPAGVAEPAEALSKLDDAARAAIRAADTFFVASRAGDGIDMSHRGGRPGFVRVKGDTLEIPDFRGNRYFNTLGNLLIDGRCGLLFADFASGDLLQVEGRAEIDWNAGGAVEGAERVWRVHVARAWRRVRALPLRWRLGGYSPQLGRTGVWR